MARLIPVDEEENQEESSSTKLIPTASKLVPVDEVQEKTVNESIGNKLVPVDNEQELELKPELEQKQTKSKSLTMEDIAEESRQSLSKGLLRTVVGMGQTVDLMVKGVIAWPVAQVTELGALTVTGGDRTKAKKAAEYVTNVIMQKHDWTDEPDPRAVQTVEKVSSLFEPLLEMLRTGSDLTMESWGVKKDSATARSGQILAELSIIPLTGLYKSATKNILTNTKANIISGVKDRIKNAENPVVQQDLVGLKEVNNAIGPINAAEIPEGKIVDLNASARIQPENMEVIETFAKDRTVSILPEETMQGTKYSLLKANGRRLSIDERQAEYFMDLRDKMPADKLVQNMEIKAQAMRDAGLLESNQFKATENIKEYQKEIIASKTEDVEFNKNITEIAKNETLTKEARKEKIKEAVLNKQKRDTELEQMKFYEDTPDPLTVNKNEVIQNQLFKEDIDLKTQKIVTQKDIVGVATKKGLNYNAIMDSSGTISFNVKDPQGNIARFSSLLDTNDYIINWTPNFAEMMAKEYQIKANTIDNAKELVTPIDIIERVKPAKEVVKIREHTIKGTGEVIQYKKVSELKKAYEERGLEWKEATIYNKQKKIDAETIKMIDDSIPPSETSVPQPSITYKDIFPKYESRIGEQPGVFQWAEPFRAVAYGIEERTGFPMSKYYHATQEALLKEQQSLVVYEKRLNFAKKGHNVGDAKLIYKALENPAFEESKGSYANFRKSILDNTELKNQFDSFTLQHYNSARILRTILQDAGTEYGIPVEKMITNYAPRMLKDGITSWKEAINKWKLPDEYKWAAEEERTGYLTPHEENIFKVVDSYLRRGARKKFNGSNIEELSKVANNEKFARADGDQIRKYIETLRGIPTSFDQTIQTTGRVFGDFLNKMINTPAHWFGSEGSRRYINPKYERMNVTKRMVDEETGIQEDVTVPRYIKTGESPGFFDTNRMGQDLANLHLKLSYSGALAWRPVVFIRDAGQSMLTLPIVGTKGFAYAHTKLFSPEAWKEAKAAGALLDDSIVAGGEMSKAWTALDDITRTFTIDVTAGHNIGRLIAYHGEKYNILNEGARYLKATEGITDKTILTKQMKNFITNSGVDFFHPKLIENEVLPLLKARDINSLAERMAIHATHETQWLYRKANAPYWARSTAGRVFGQFGVWPSWYIEYAKNIATRGTPINRTKRIAMLVGINGLVYEAGKEIFGVNVSNWMFTHPTQWYPIPLTAVQAAQKVVKGSEYDQQEAAGQLQDLALMHIPAYLSVKSMIKAQDEYREEDMVKRFMGFKPAEE